MPVSGPAQKEQKHGRTPNLAWTEVPNVPYAGEKPRFPLDLNIGDVPDWWDVVSAMPHCVLWERSDWMFAIETARLRAQLEREFSTTLAVEIRRREDVMGVTRDARQKLRIRYVDLPETASTGQPAADATVTSIADRRRRLVSDDDA